MILESDMEDRHRVRFGVLSYCQCPSLPQNSYQRFLCHHAIGTKSAALTTNDRNFYDRACSEDGQPRIQPSSLRITVSSLDPLVIPGGIVNSLTSRFFASSSRAQRHIART
jgi:hypothetical protein